MNPLPSHYGEHREANAEKESSRGFGDGRNRERYGARGGIGSKPMRSGRCQLPEIDVGQ